jgi:hypothetical protein
MSSNRGSELDLLSLAEDVAFGRRSLDNVIDQIAVVTPDDRERRRAVAELQSLVVALTGVRAHARATAATTREPAGGSAARDLLIEPRPVVRRRPRFGTGGTFAAGATAVAAVVVLAVVIVSLRPGASVGAPSPAPSGEPSAVASDAPSASGSVPASSATSAVPSSPFAPSSPTPPSPVPTPTASQVPPATPVTPPATPSPSAPATPVPTARPTVAPSATAAEGLPPIQATSVAGPISAYWALTAPDRLQVWLWNPLETRMVAQLAAATWPGSSIQRIVLISPDGSRVAIQEIDSTTNSPVQRVRIISLTGDVLWTAPKLPLVTAMAWSPDGTALAIGSLPFPWTVVQLNAGAKPEVTTYNLDDRDGYALLGFSTDGNTLYGYGTGGEADFWEKPVALDRARGTLTNLDSFPAGSAALSHASSTAPVAQVDASGRVLALAGGAKGDLHWIIRDAKGDTPVAVGTDAQLAWGGEAPIVALSRIPVNDETGLAVRRLDATGAELPGAVPLPAGSYSAVLAGAREDFALVALTPIASQRDREPVHEVVLVDLATGATAVGLPPAGADGSGFTFAGWLSP